MVVSHQCHGCNKMKLVVAVLGICWGFTIFAKCFSVFATLEFNSVQLHYMAFLKMFMVCYSSVPYYHISSVVRPRFFLPKQSQKSRFIL